MPKQTPPLEDIRRDLLLAHKGHTLTVAVYGKGYGTDEPEGPPVNVALECEDCSTVLEDYDLPT